MYTCIQQDAPQLNTLADAATHLEISDVEYTNKEDQHVSVIVYVCIRLDGCMYV